MSNNKASKKKNSILPILILFLLLIVLPGGSIYYLSEGYKHQVNTYKELKNYGQIPDFKLATQNGDILEKKDLKGKTVVAAFTSLEELKNNPDFQKYIIDLNKQFSERDDLVMLAYLTNTDSLTNQDKIALSEKYQLKNPNQWQMLTGNPTLIKKLAQNGYQVPIIDRPSFVLADTSLTIRNYYDALNYEEVSKLAMQVAMLLPRAPRKDAILKREREK